MATILNHKYGSISQYIETPKRYRTRIAPSPTGHAHIGTFRTAYFCYLAARASKGSFMLRIDDTDTNRNDESAVNPIYEAFEWLGLDTDSRVRQSDNSDGYYGIARDLVNEGLAIVLDNGAIALKWNADMPREWHDNIAGKMVINDTNIQQIDGRLILCKGKEGKYAPTYQLASTFDDHRYGINYVIRGTDHISNTPKQMALWWALNKLFDPMPYPEWAHIGLIFKDGKKLSKRDGAASVLEWRDKGYTPDALKSFMLRLGWAPKVDNKENDLLGEERAISMFLTEGKMRNSSANMDVAKLDAYERKTRALYGKGLCADIDKRTHDIKKIWLGYSAEPTRLGFEDVDQPQPVAIPGYELYEGPTFPEDELSVQGSKFIERMKYKTRKKKLVLGFDNNLGFGEVAAAPAGGQEVRGGLRQAAGLAGLVNLGQPADIARRAAGLVNYRPRVGDPIRDMNAAAAGDNFARHVAQVVGAQDNVAIGARAFDNAIQEANLVPRPAYHWRDGAVVGLDNEEDQQGD